MAELARGQRYADSMCPRKWLSETRGGESVGGGVELYGVEETLPLVTLGAVRKLFVVGCGGGT